MAFLIGIQHLPSQLPVIDFRHSFLRISSFVVGHSQLPSPGSSAPVRDEGLTNNVLHFDLAMLTLQPLNHELIFLTWREAGPDRFPRTTSADAAVFRLGNADETFLRYGIDRMVVDFEPPFKLERVSTFSRERISLMHRHE